MHDLAPAHELDSTITHLRELMRRAAYLEASTFFDGLPATIQCAPAIAVLQSRIRARQGYATRALAVLDAVPATSSDPGQRCLLQLEQAFVKILHEGRFRSSLAAAQAAVVSADSAGVPAATRAEIDNVHARIALCAATYYELSAPEVVDVLARLERAAVVLFEHGRAEDSLNARVTRASRLASHEARLHELALLTAQADQLSFPSIAADCQLRLSELLATRRAPVREIETALDRAAERFVTARHVLGPLDLSLARAQLAVERADAPVKRIEACLDGYQAADHPQGMIYVLMALSQHAQAGGRTALSADYYKRLLEITESTGLGLTRDSTQLGVADLLVRTAAYRPAIELCRAELERHPPKVSEGNYRQLLGCALARVGDSERALKECQESLRCYEISGAEPLASIAVGRLANELFTTRQPDVRDQAIALLHTWIEKDELRGEAAAAAAKHGMIAQGCMHVLLGNATAEEKRSRRAQAEQALAAADEIAARLGGREAAKLVANGWQLRAQIATGAGEPEEFQRALEHASTTYAAASFDFEAANCRYLLGVQRLDQANTELMPHFGASEHHLKAALEYYTSENMRDQAANCRWLLAQLYVNAALRVAPDLASQLRAAALSLLSTAEQDYDVIRRAYGARSAVEAQDGKRALVSKSARIYDLALQVLTEHAPNHEQAWHWVQRAKARSLGDALGHATPPSVLAAAPESPLRDLIDREQALSARVAAAASGEWQLANEELEAMHLTMSNQRELHDYLRFRLALPATRIQAQQWLAAEQQVRMVWVDWFVVRGRLWLSLLRADGEPVVEPLALSIDAVRAWLGSHLSPNALRFTLKEAEPTLLRELDALVAPLARHCKPEELLVLSPTGPLHALPLHALHVCDAPLIVRHPVLYSPSFHVLEQCVARGADRSFREPRLFGDPRGDRPVAAALVRELGERFAVEPMLEQRVTRAALDEALANGRMLHFQGHASYVAHDPLASHLKLAADERLTVRDLLEGPPLRLGLVTLAACESAVNAVALGDELTGLVPAFLYAGAASVLATLWTVPADTTALAMRHFYGTLATSPGTSKAHALRDAVLAVRAQPGRSAPYWWAGLALSGDWR